MAVATLYQGMIYNPFGLGCLFSDISILEVPVAIGAVPGALQSGVLEPEVGVVSNGDRTGILHQDVLGLVQLLEVDKLNGVYKVNGVDMLAGVKSLI